MFDLIGTIAPQNLELLPKMRAAGLTRGRIPERFFASLDALAEFARRIDRLDPQFPLSLDLRGAKTTLILDQGEFLELKPGVRFKLALHPVEGLNNSGVPLVVPSFFPEEAPGILFFKDGDVIAHLIRVEDRIGLYEVHHGEARLSLGSGIHMAGETPPVTPGLTHADRALLERFARDEYLAKRFDQILLSFVENDAIIREAHDIVPRQHIIAKIESIKGFRALKPIIKAASEVKGGVALAEGDGALAFGAALPRVREEVLRVTRQAGLPAFVYTILSSMSSRPIPSPGDCISFLHAVQQGARGVLISDPLLGPFAIEAVCWAVKLFEAAQLGSYKAISAWLSQSKKIQVKEGSLMLKRKERG